MPKSNTSKEASTEIVDVAGIDTRMFTLPREVLIRGNSVRKSAEAIVAVGNEP